MNCYLPNDDSHASYFTSMGEGIINATPSQISFLATDPGVRP